ncbi:MAG: YqeG family HAD IIIA-type phosphatase [Clostridiaceae bacterium]|nr:YqeG family HAD IIIA-type phosphatase [Clostridiaceae bacterium]
MKHPLRPDLVFRRVSDIKPGLLRDMGITTVLCDLDNTLVAPKRRRPTPSAIAWLECMRAGGIRVMLVSNNSMKRVREFCRNLPFDGIPQARKPLPFGLTRARRTLHATVAETAFLGDQLFTDILAARLAGLTALYVRPVKPEKGWFFNLKRRLEQPFLRGFEDVLKDS